MYNDHIVNPLCGKVMPVLYLTQGLFYKTLHIHNVQQMDRLLVYLFVVTFTGVGKHTSLLHDPYIMNT